MLALVPWQNCCNAKMAREYAVLEVLSGLEGLSVIEVLGNLFYLNRCLLICGGKFEDNTICKQSNMRT